MHESDINQSCQVTCVRRTTVTRVEDTDMINASRVADKNSVHLVILMMDCQAAMEGKGELFLREPENVRDAPIGKIGLKKVIQIDFLVFPCQTARKCSMKLW